MESNGFRRVLLSFALSGCLLLMGLSLTPDLAAAKGDKVSELYRASTGSASSTASAAIDIKIHRFSTEADKEILVQALEANGSEGLFRALTKQKKTGLVSVRGESGHPTYYTQEYTDAGQRHIVILTDQGFLFRQAYEKIKTKTPFNMITMTLDDEGNGEGVASLGTEAVWDEAKGVLRITGEPAGTVRLSGIRLIKKK